MLTCRGTLVIEWKLEDYNFEITIEKVGCDTYDIITCIYREEYQDEPQIKDLRVLLFEEISSNE